MIIASVNSASADVEYQGPSPNVGEKIPGPR
jgi:hypothetical protein